MIISDMLIFHLIHSYYRNEFSCVDINECDVQRRKMSPCSADEMCVNLQGGHKCMNAEEADCPAGGFYRKLMKTDEFTHKQVANLKITIKESD